MTTTHFAQVKNLRNNAMTTVKIGDVVAFKNDVEQTGRISHIELINGNAQLTLTSPSPLGFTGDYISGQKETVEMARDCYLIKR